MSKNGIVLCVLAFGLSVIPAAYATRVDAAPSAIAAPDPTCLPTCLLVCVTTGLANPFGLLGCVVGCVTSCLPIP